MEPAAFDVGAAKQVALEARFGSRRSVKQGVWIQKVSFLSTQWTAAGASRPIRIQGLLAAPVSPGKRPGVIIAHGLGGRANAGTVVEVARNLDVVALAISAPGLGGSQGRAVTFQDARPLFATVPDVRGSGLYAYTFALLRAVTFLRSLPLVDPDAVVLTGNSLGGLASLIANGVDERIRGVLAMSASGGLAQAARRGSWLQRLVLSAGGLHLDDAGPTRFFEALDPLAFASTQRGVVYLLSGAQDEFFPIDQVVRTFEALQAPAKMLSLIADYDHGWYFSRGCPARCMPGGAERSRKGCPGNCPLRCAGRWPYCGPHASYNRHDDATARWALLLRALVARASHPPRPFPTPPMPVVERRGEGAIVRVSGARPAAVRLAFSDNGGFTYAQVALAPRADGSYSFPGPLPAKAVVFAEVEAPDGAVVTSVPEFPPEFVPVIRPFSPLEKTR